MACSSSAAIMALNRDVLAVEIFWAPMATSSEESAIFFKAVSTIIVETAFLFVSKS